MSFEKLRVALSSGIGLIGSGPFFEFWISYWTWTRTRTRAWQFQELLPMAIWRLCLLNAMWKSRRRRMTRMMNTIHRELRSVFSNSEDIFFLSCSQGLLFPTPILSLKFLSWIGPRKIREVWEIYQHHRCSQNLAETMTLLSMRIVSKITLSYQDQE